MTQPIYTNPTAQIEVYDLGNEISIKMPEALNATYAKFFAEQGAVQTHDAQNSVWTMGKSNVSAVSIIDTALGVKISDRYLPLAATPAREISVPVPPLTEIPAGTVPADPGSEASALLASLRTQEARSPVPGTPNMLSVSQSSPAKPLPTSPAPSALPATPQPASMAVPPSSPARPALPPNLLPVPGISAQQLPAALPGMPANLAQLLAGLQTGPPAGTSYPTMTAGPTIPIVQTAVPPPALPAVFVPQAPPLPAVNYPSLAAVPGGGLNMAMLNQAQENMGGMNQPVDPNYPRLVLDKSDVKIVDYTPPSLALFGPPAWMAQSAQMFASLGGKENYRLKMDPSGNIKGHGWIFSKSNAQAMDTLNKMMGGVDLLQLAPAGKKTSTYQPYGQAPSYQSYGQPQQFPSCGQPQQFPRPPAQGGYGAVQPPSMSGGMPAPPAVPGIPMAAPKVDTAPELMSKLLDQLAAPLSAVARKEMADPSGVRTRLGLAGPSLLVQEQVQDYLQRYPTEKYGSAVEFRIDYGGNVAVLLTRGVAAE